MQTDPLLFQYKGDYEWGPYFSLHVAGRSNTVPHSLNTYTAHSVVQACRSHLGRWVGPNGGLGGWLREGIAAVGHYHPVLGWHMVAIIPHGTA